MSNNEFRLFRDAFRSTVGIDVPMHEDSLDTIMR